VKLRLNFTLLLGVVALTLAVIQWIHPFGGQPRISPVIIVVILLLVGARYAARQQTQKRAELMKEVPERPLGLSEDPVENPPGDGHPPTSHGSI
jgi:hypothetical protein